MKTIIVILTLVCSAIPGICQFRLGVETGMNVVSTCDDNPTKIGWNIGVTGEYIFSNRLLIDTELKLGAQPFSFSENYGYIGESSEVVTYRDKVCMNPYFLTLPVRIGYSFHLSRKCQLNLSGGPAIGCGLFGSGKIKTTGPDSNQSGAHDNISDVFSKSGKNVYPLGRFEIGGSIKAGFTFADHYTISTTFNLMRLTETHSIKKQISNWNINLGYKF